MTQTLFLPLLAVFMVGCGHSTLPVETVAPEPTAPPETPALPEPQEVEPLAPFVGHYRLSGSIESDGCNGQIHLAARNITIDEDLRLLHADVVERDFTISAEGDQLLAEGRFPATSCPESTIFERWRLARMSDGSLEGTLVSLWLLPPCRQACLVRFNVTAESADPAQ